MSTSSSDADPLPAGIGLFGGIPTTADLGPSAVFLAGYALIFPIAIWRALSPKTRTWVLLRPNVFIAARMATFAIRLVIATENYYSNTGLFVAEMILELSGFNIICEPLVRVLEQNLHASAYNNGIQEPALVVKILRLMRLGLLASLILGIYTGTQYGPDANVSQLNTYRLATSGLNVGIVGLTIVFSALLHRAYNCPPRATMFVLGVGALLIFPSAYRLHCVIDLQDNFGAKIKAEFYVLDALFEWLATLPFLIVNLRQVFDLDYKHPGSGGPIGAVVTRVREIMGRPDHVNHPPRNASPTNAQQSEQGQQLPYYGNYAEEAGEKNLK